MEPTPPRSASSPDRPQPPRVSRPQLEARLDALPAGGVALLVAPQMRGRMMAIYLLVANLIGMGLGPLLVGILSDRFDGMIGYAVAITATFGTLSGLLLLGWSRPAIRKAITAQLTSAN